MLSFFPRGVLDEILNLIESVSEGFPSYSCMFCAIFTKGTILHVLMYVSIGQSPFKMGSTPKNSNTSI